MIFEAVALRGRGAGCPGGWIQLQAAREEVGRAGITADMFQEGIANWESLGVFRRDREADSVQLSQEGLLWSPEGPPPAGPVRRVMGVLALSDSLGVARLGVGDVLRSAGVSASLCGSWFADPRGRLAASVSACWRGDAALGAGPPRTSSWQRTPGSS